MKIDSDTLALTEELIRRESVTPDDAGCQQLLGERLQAAGFVLESMAAGPVSNLWATHGDDTPTLVLAGHTDVVPPGPPAAWTTPPFAPSQRDGYLYGRGAADMKSSLAAMTLAAGDFVQANPRHRGRLALLITSDEEGPADDGTRHVVDILSSRGECLDYCIVGEPSSRERLGDVLRTGRRGSLNGHLIVHGTQGHVAYADLANNPIHGLAPALAELADTVWDEGQPPFPPTTFQISNISAGTGAENIIPGSLEMRFNFRYCPALTPADIEARVEAVLRRHAVNFRLEWRLSGEPFNTLDGPLLEAVDAAIFAHTGSRPEHSTGGGTSDGRFIAKAGTQVVELGPVNASIHKVDECVSLEDLGLLRALYRSAIENLLG